MAESTHRPRGRPRRNDNPQELGEARTPPIGEQVLDQVATALDRMTQLLERQTERESNVNGNNNLQEGNGNGVDNMLERFLKYSRPRFTGEPDDEKDEAWLEAIENIYDALDYTDEKKITFVVFLLDGDAKRWWRTVKLRWEQQHIALLWANFVQEFNDKYIPEVVQEKREEEFMSFKQGNVTVAQYEARFNKLSQFAPEMVQTPKQRIRRFVKGLRADIQDSLAPFQFTTYSEAINAAFRVEKRRNESRGESSQPSKRPFPLQGQQRQTQKQT